MKLCYRASVNGWASSTFHSMCDNKGPTVVLVKSGQYVFGGYAATQWGGESYLKNTLCYYSFSLSKFLDIDKQALILGSIINLSATQVLKFSND